MWRRGVRDLIRDICGQHDVAILKGHVWKGHVHLLVSIPPQTTISRLMQWLKGRTAHHLLSAQYIANQNTKPDEDFRVDG